MRAALSICVLLAVGCTASGPLVRPASQSPSQVALGSPSPSTRASLSSGGVIEYALPDPQPPGSSCEGCGRASVNGIAAGSDGNLWFTDSGHQKVGRITPAGAITEFDLPAAAGSPYGIAAGSDGVWITTNAGGKGRPDWIVRMSPDGSATKFQAGTRAGQGFGTGPESITVASDGTVWFTEFWSNKIGRLTPAGALTEFPIPTPESAPRGIVAGSDGNVWFVEGSRSHTAIAKITPAGSITEYVYGTAPNDLYPTGIVAGPDGNLWFTQPNLAAPQGDIGRVTMLGVITTFPLPKGTRPGGIAKGADGNLWFTDGGAGTVGRMSTTGVLRQFPLLRRNAQLSGIAAGPDGRMWFSEGSWIGSIGVTVPATKLSSRVLTFNQGSAPRAVDITNSGEAPLKIAGVVIAGSDRDAFTMTKDGCSNRALAVNASCGIEVSFTPGSYTGVRAARVAITDNATGSPHSVSLTAQVPDCKLPLFVSMASSSQGQFLTLRDGAVVDDPAGRFVTDGLQSKSRASPVLKGYMPATYNRATGRWVPAGGKAITPDGLRYAYIDSTQLFEGQLHVVDVVTGRDRTLPLAKGPWGLVGFTNEGVYIHTSYEGSGPGLTLINPDSGAASTVFSDSIVHLVSGEMAWITARNSNDTLPEPPGIGGSSNEVLSRDLVTSQKTSWLYRPGTDVYVNAAAKGSIVVTARDWVSNVTLVVTAPGQATPITAPETNEPIPMSGGAVGDANGWWFGSLDGVYLWTAHTGAILVSEATAAPAGACA
jgi:virginiamycin B lyase